MFNDIRIINYVQLNLNDMLCLTIISDIQNDINFMFYIAIFNEFESRMSNNKVMK